MANGAGSIQARLDAARSSRFVGREAELELIGAALERDVPPFSVVHVHGPPGIGKSSLLAEIATRAAGVPRTVVRISGREIDPSTAGVEEAIADALGARNGQPARPADSPRLLLMIDTYEALGALDRWVRDQLVPSLADDALVILASRLPPSPDWRLDRGWAELLRELPLRDLPDQEARSLLSMHDVPPEHHDQILEATGGHPLAVELAAGAWRDSSANGWDASVDPRVMGDLLGAFLDGVPSGTHREALEAASFTGVATEELLRSALDTPDPGALFDWLRTLSFTEPTSRGLAVHDLVRELLLADLHWRNPDRFAQLHEAVTLHLEERMARSSGPARRRAMLDLLQLYRFNPVTRGFYDWSDPEAMHVEPALETDHDAIVAMTREHEGDESARVARYWLDRQPEVFRVFRRPDAAEPAGFVANLLLDQPGDEINEDPIAAAAWRHVRAHGALRAGERIRIMRFWVAADT
ncbi:MAG: ATP-binding protein, partial [Nitriliruptorales bacterium]|nr:ATP-binding protein [Nitriliruptorales bacterium]